jgi:hypothetical protein
MARPDQRGVGNPPDREHNNADKDKHTSQEIALLQLRPGYAVFLSRIVARAIRHPVLSVFCQLQYLHPLSQGLPLPKP